MVPAALMDKDGLPPLACKVDLTPGLFEAGEYEYVTFASACKIQHQNARLKQVDSRRLPFAFDVPCDYWGRSAIIDPDDRDDERDFGLMYSLDLHITRSLGENRSDTILVQFPTKQDVAHAMEANSPAWRHLYQRRFFSLVVCPVDPGETAPSLE